MRKAAKRKVSYVITHNKDDHGHLLGINSLALDTTTFDSSGKPGGVLYSAGRDGVINSWDLHLSLRERKIPKYNYNNLNGIEGKKGNVKDDDNIPLHQFSEVKNWEIDENASSSSQPTPKSTFRQSFQSHTDWVNDIILCHNNEALISCSSDRTMKLWFPHKTSIPCTIGYHTDYIKALAYASGPGWVASGGFDKKIALWDIKECRLAPSTSSSSGNIFGGLSERDFQPIVTIAETSPKSSVYALACNPSGSVLVSGSPEKVIKVWDPKSGKRITKLSGHTDNIRAILISDDGELILSGSSDTTIKLWSLSTQRCINTFTTHSDSIWSLYSDHPRLKVFYAGAKDGLVTRTDYSEYEEIDDGECVAICKENAGIVKLVALDNKYIWTATCSSSIKRWQDVPLKKDRINLSTSSPPSSTSQNAFQIPSSSLIKLTSAVSPPQLITATTDSEVATIYSVAIDEGHNDIDNEDPEPVREMADHIIEGQHGLIKYVILNNRRNILTLDNNGEVTLWDIIKCVKVKVFGKCNIDEIAQEINTPESIPNWCSVDTRIGALTVHLDESKCFDAEMYADEAGLTGDVDIREDQRINLGKWVLRYLFANFTQEEIHTYEAIQQQRSLMQQRQQPGSEHRSLFATQLNVNIPPQAATSTTFTSPTASNQNSTNSKANPPMAPSPTTPLAAFTTGPFTAPATTSSQQPDYFSGPHHLNSPTTSPTTPPVMLLSLLPYNHHRPHLLIRILVIVGPPLAL
ncbi:6755_t:CDS:10 [Funneliformis geosporum]|uniref:6755_t:CDS:1 n=1 Tax=Funneliformis geosporum TaxID=1117311 RepID=A0A9W4SNL6_9GLOM|nr:6755_t:CDS:10 [Funneliformis geosporum]